MNDKTVISREYNNEHRSIDANVVHPSVNSGTSTLIQTDLITDLLDSAAKPKNKTIRQRRRPAALP